MNKSQYLYVLKAVRPAMLVDGLTPSEVQIAEQHSAYLTELAKQGMVVLYGRTQNHDESAFGIVVLEAESEEEARRLMLEDPGVKLGLMRSTLFPYRIAYLRNNTHS